MRNRPSIERRNSVPAAPQSPGGPPPPPDLGDVIEPFLVCGGATFFVQSEAAAFDPAPAGVQLVSHVYVPRGYVGFIKQLRVAPFMPAVLVDPWETAGVVAGVGGDATTSWHGFDAVPNSPVRPGGRNGVWETPFGWESYFDAASCFEQPPQWTWQLRLMQGNAARNRAVFNILDPATWALIPNLAVPVAGYPNGIPGSAPGGAWGPQRMQVLQGDELDTHVVVPQDHTALLFVQWTQNEFQPQAVVQTDGAQELLPYGDLVYPLLPSFGQLHGYMQAVDRMAANENARFGWGG